MTTIYGPIVTGEDVEVAVTATIQAWTPAYTAEVARQKAITLPPIRAYGQSLDQLPNGTIAQELPACIITSPGIADDPVEHGDGSVDAVWAVGVGLVVTGQTSDASVRLAKIYGATIRSLLVQKGSLGGFANGTRWIDEETVPIAFDTARSVAACTLMFEVSVSAVMSRFGGPASVPANPQVAISTGTVLTAKTTISRQ